MSDPPSPKAARDPSLDWLRGLVMLVMVLDHARDFVHGMRDDPTDLATTTPLLFATRWITHFCAPVFVFLAGTSAYLYAERRTPHERTRFLLTRGAWLVLLELTVMKIAWIPEPFYRFVLLQVIWALGVSMIALAGLAMLPRGWIVAISAAVLLLHNTLDPIVPDDLGSLGWLWTLVHERGTLTVAKGHRVFASYPLLPWIFVMALGYAFGPIARRDAAARARWCVRAGLLLIAGFFLLRALNLYGDPQPWQPQRAPWLTVVSFFNVEKYPPSLDYLAMTLGPALLVLSIAPTKVGHTVTDVVVTIGRVPLFFYVAHLYLLRFGVGAVAFARFGAAALGPPPNGHAGSPELGLGWVYLVWVAALALLYPACRWFAAVKARSTKWWMSYL